MRSDPEPIAVCWSGGKDSSLALHVLRSDSRYRIAALVTTFTEGFGRVSMHGVRHELLAAQAKALGLPLTEVWIPPKASNEIYEARMAKSLRELRESSGISSIAFGDIFLADLKRYRERQLAELGLGCLFPLWNRDTRELAAEFVRLGFRGVTTCIDPSRLDNRFIGRELEESFFAELPENCDPCGENGEFHSFVYDGPGGSRPVLFSPGEIVPRDSFLYCDLVPHSATAPLVP